MRVFGSVIYFFFSLDSDGGTEPDGVVEVTRAGGWRGKVGTHQV